MRYLSVCSGIEAATQAWHPLGWRPVAFSEIEPFPCHVLHHRWGASRPMFMPGVEATTKASERAARKAAIREVAKLPETAAVPNWGDMTRFAEWPDAAIDLLVGGTPCQSFSVAGLRQGLRDPRGNLALVYLALADRYRPDWLVWENVPGVLSSNGGRDFGAFLGGMAELGYGFAYRVLDAQYVRTRRFGRAVPQRRRRVFVVGYLGDWRRAAAVLFDRESLLGNPPPRREAGEGVARRASARNHGGSEWPACVAPTLGTAWADRHPGSSNQDFIAQKGGLFVPGTVLSHDPACTLTARERKGPLPEADLSTVVAHALRGEGFDASEDGTGRGTPLVPIPFDTTQTGAHPPAVAFAHQAGGKQTTLGYSDDGTCQTPAVAFGIDSDCLDRSGEGVAGTAGERSGLGITEQHINALRAKRPNAVATPWAVRRLTPRECERLQGFPDDMTNIPWRGKAEAPDGPRYKALGNSMAVNVMGWLGERIELVNSVARSAA